MIKTIIFDIGEVVSITGFSPVWTSFAKHIGISPQYIFNYHKENLEDFFVGKLTLTQFWQDLKDAGGRDGIDYEKTWITEGLKCTEVDSEMIEIIKKLREDYTVAALTNITPTRIIIDEKLGLYSHFDYAFLSCKEHLMKPDPKFYKQALFRTHTEPQDAIYIDDNEAYTDGAQAVGIHPLPYTYKKSAEMREALKKWGVKI